MTDETVCVYLLAYAEVEYFSAVPFENVVFERSREKQIGPIQY